MHRSVRDVGGIALEVGETGRGRPILWLHGIEKLCRDPPVLERLGQEARVIAPSHPGFAASPLPDWFDAIDDIVYLYLDLIEAMELRDIVLVGLSMGGWIAAEMAVRSVERVSHLVLVSPFGIKPGDRTSRDVPDIFALPPDAVSRMVWHDRGLAPDLATLPDGEAEELMRHQEAAALFLWEPYMHHPKLRRRLHRVRVPTLVLRGAHDGLVSDAYARAYAGAIPGARFAVIADAGHVPEYEQPAALADQILTFTRPRER